MLEISMPDTIQDMWRIEIPLHDHAFLAWKTFIFSIFICFSMDIIPKITQPG